ncbi:MAG: radical SAM protein [Oscillospiraceae bacterium]|jgi:Predicted Fe-S oxidoreductases|nr:radical SAM protein [Oscillospiraceae bacterium]
MNQANRPFTMNMELTTRCPLMCPFCYCTLNNGKDLPLEKAIFWLREAKKSGIVMVSLSGGETLCYPHLEEVIKEGSRLGLEINVALSGYNFTEKRLESLISAGVSRIYISLNGSTAEINNKSRNGYDLAMNALNLLARYGYKNTCMNWVMQDFNTDDFKNIVTIAEQHNVRNLVILGLKPTSKKELAHFPTRDQLNSIAKFACEYRGTVNLRIEPCYSCLNAAVKEMSKSLSIHSPIYSGCLAGQGIVSVNVDGEITPCRHLDIPESFTTIESYLNGSEILKQIQLARGNVAEPCRSCGYRAGCLHCLAINYLGKNRIQYGFEGCPMYVESQSPLKLAKGIPLPGKD